MKYIKKIPNIVHRLMCMLMIQFRSLFEIMDFMMKNNSTVRLLFTPEAPQFAPILRAGGRISLFFHQFFIK